MKDKIIEVSVALFEQKGFSETSIQDIVEALGVTKGTFYYYFNSKEALLMDIHSVYINSLLGQQEAILNDEAKSSAEKVTAMIEMLLVTIRQAGSSAKIFFRELSHLNEERLALILPKREAFRENIEQLLQQGIDAKEFRADLDIAIVTFGILGMGNWSYQWYRPDGRLSQHEVAHHFANMILHGISNH
ncbi:TetR family transcriptional regulator [Fictibacillus macauensis ZFHKF-1]|uniref:TetR family transcriptional regulator n=1 Tax=Fictibacillus macauensis ZFHKF-1 TaxID=1196324 RepID=I8J4N1_9BACL|nr:TetR/AcrR family transcriptional regulator [Fictibacillus macauensis]EIT86736.1 TetR family transcriptional regulator [Fictibacillus macauensis ZFHKF-1]